MRDLFEKIYKDKGPLGKWASLAEGYFVMGMDNLITGDLIYITSFETKNNAEDLNIITDINNPQGHICTRLSNTTISINVDFSQIIVNNRPLAINNYTNSSNPQDLSVIVYFELSKRSKRFSIAWIGLVGLGGFTAVLGALQIGH